MGRVLLQKGCLQSGWEACWALSQLNSRTLRQGKDEWVHGPQKWGCNVPAGSGLGGAGELGRHPPPPQGSLVPGGSPEACLVQEGEPGDSGGGGGLNVLLKREELLFDVFLKT